MSGDLFAYHFMVNALWAGSLAAVTAGLVGWFAIVRAQTFAAHTLSLVSFPGATGAALIGLPTLFGYFGACVAGAVVIARASGPRGRGHESAAIGTLQAMLLGCGFLFASLDHRVLDALGAPLLGTFLGITDAQVLVLAAIATGTSLALALVGRRLLFASLDPEVARARGIPVTGLSTGFLLLLGLAVAATAQITGALLVFALLVVPAATAQTLTARPALGLALSLLNALIVTWAGLVIAYFSPYPVGFWVTSLGFGAFVLARLARR